DYQIAVLATGNNVNTSLGILRGIAGDLLIRPESVEIEGQAVIAEGIKSSGLGKRMLDAIQPKLLGNPNYVNRGVREVGSLSSTETFKHATLLRFYKDWYRPNLQAVVVVGDIIPDSVEAIIVKTFSDLQNPSNQRTRVNHTPFTPSKNKLIVFSDREQKNIAIQIHNKYPGPDRKTLMGLKESIVMKLYNKIIQLHFDRLTRRYSSPALYINHQYRELAFAQWQGISDAVTELGVDSISQIKPAITSAFEILNGIKKNGIDKELFSDIKLMIKSQLEVAEPIKQNTASELVYHFLYGNIPMDIEAKLELERKLLKEITVSDVNEFAVKVITDDNRSVVAMVPAALKGSLPTLEIFETWIKSANKHSKLITKPIKDKNRFEPVILKGKGKIVKVTMLSGIDAIEVLLANGVKVILKQVPHTSSERIIIRAFSNMGAKSFGEDFYIHTRYSAMIFENSGIANLDKFHLQDYLENHRLKLDVQIHDYSSDIKGVVEQSKGVHGLKTLLHLLQQYFIAPRKSAEAFVDWKTNLNRDMNQIDRQTLLADSVRIYTLEPQELTDVSTINDVSLDKAYEAHQHIFNDASGFTFVVTGRFEVDSILPLIEKYLGVLPSKKPNKVISVNIPSSVYLDDPVKKIFYTIDEHPKIMLRFTGNINNTIKNRIYLDAVIHFIQPNVLERLREKEKGVYSVGVDAYTFSNPNEKYVVAINFSTTDENLERHLAAAKDEVNKFRNMLVNGDLVKEYVEMEKESWRRNLHSNAFWNRYLNESYQDAQDPNDILNYSRILDQLTPELIQAAARRYLSEDAYMEFIAMPTNQKLQSTTY
ncbi:MAG: insulinase family protein, partial [Sphingobacteriales bacterium]